MPTDAATLLAPSSSPVATAGDSAVIASACSPRTRAATAATSDESTPPENATIALGVAATDASRSASAGIGPDPSRRRGERRRPDLLHRTTELGGDVRAVVVLGRGVHDAALEARHLHAHLMTVDLDGLDRALEFVPADRHGADAEARAVLEQRAGDRSLARGPRDGGDVHAGAALLHLHRRRPHVERARRATRVEHVRDQ